MNNIPIGGPDSIFKDEVFRNMCHHWQEEKRCPAMFLDHFLDNEDKYPNAYQALKWAADGYGLRYKKTEEMTTTHVYPCPRELNTSTAVTRIRVPTKKTIKRRKKRKSTATGVINDGSEYIDETLYTIEGIGTRGNFNQLSRKFPINNKDMDMMVFESNYSALGRSYIYYRFNSFEAAVYAYLKYFDPNEISKLLKLRVHNYGNRINAGATLQASKWREFDEIIRSRQREIQQQMENNVLRPFIEGARQIVAAAGIQEIEEPQIDWPENNDRPVFNIESIPLPIQNADYAGIEDYVGGLRRHVVLNGLNVQNIPKEPESDYEILTGEYGAEQPRDQDNESGVGGETDGVLSE